MDSSNNSTSNIKLDQLYKKLNKSSSIAGLNDNIKLKRQITIDKKRYEQSLALESSVALKTSNVESNDSDNDCIQILEDENTNIKTEPIDNEIQVPINDLRFFKLENLEDKTIENELNGILNTSLTDDDDDNNNVIVLDSNDLTNDLQEKIKNLDINKIIEIKIKNESTLNSTEQSSSTTAIMFDSLLGTISGQNDLLINDLAQQLAFNLNLPFEFMTIDEFNKYKQDESIMTTNEISNNEDTKVFITNNEQENNIPRSQCNNNMITIRGNALIQYLFGDCSDIYKNAIERDASSSINFNTKLSNKPTKPVSYYITKKKLRKLEMQRKLKKIEQHIFEVQINRNEILNHLYVDHESTRNTYDDNCVIIDIALFKNFFYTCSLSGKCSVYNIVTHTLINSIIIDEGAQFIQPLYNDSRYYLNVLIGGGGRHCTNDKSNIYVYDSILKHRTFTIDLKSPVRCVIFRYHRLYCGLNSGEVVTINRNLNNFESIIKVSDKKISCIGVAMIQRVKYLLVGAYDGRIHLISINIYNNYYNNRKREYLLGHTMPPLSIKSYNEYIFSCSADCHILTHCLNTKRLLSKISFNHPITSLAIQNDILLSSSADGLIRCYSLENPFDGLILCQQYYGYNKNSRIMCMKCEHNYIYYGDEKGYAESIEFNLNNKNICKYSNCNQPFATKSYLLSHLLYYHFNKSNDSSYSSTVSQIKCEWNNCNQLIDLNSLKLHLLRHL